MEMSKIKRFSAVASLGLALIACLISPAQAATPLKLADIYNPLKIVRADLTLPQTSVDSLNDPQTLTTYVPATFKLSLDGKTSGDLAIKIRLKGSTSLFPLNETPSFKVKFKKDNAGNTYLGLNRMTLNGMIQDNSKIHEYGAYALFNAMGIAAPKTGWARLYINGVDRGLFVNVEQPDHVFMQKRFKDITQHIYEGIARKDFNFGNDTGDNASGAFLVDYGWKVTANKRDLTRLINYANDWDPVTWYKGLSNVVDRTSMIKFFAVENFLGHWDGYSGPDINNYYIRSNTKSKFTFIPWGVDQTFGENRKTEVLGDTFDLSLLSDTSAQPWGRETNRGKLYVMCINYKPCRTEYLTDLKAVSAMATKMKLATNMKAAAKLIDPVLLSQFSASAERNLIHSEQTRSIGYIAKRQSQVAALLKKYGIK